MKAVIVFIFSCLSVIAADEKEILFEQANKAYELADYTQAIQLYEKIVQLGFENGELYYNLGNAYFKNKQIAKAILNYERAKKLIPHDEDLKTNLQIANLSIPDKITPVPRLFIWDWLIDFRDFFGINLLAVLSLGGLVFSAVSISYWIWTKSRTAINIAILFGSIFIFFLSFFTWAGYSDKKGIGGIVQDQKVSVYSAPDETSTELFVLHEGVKIEVQKNAGEWIEIRLADGKVGWLQKGSIETI